MKSKLYILLVAGISVLALSCKTAKKMYEKGNYTEAVELAAKKLQKDPDDAKLLDIIQSSYRYAVNDHEGRVRNNAESTSELKWEWMYNDYAALQRMYDAIYRVPSVFNLVKPLDYSSYLITYSEKAGDVRYDRGLAFMQRYDKKSYQAAYREFQAALHFKPGNRDAMQKLNEAYDYAVTNVVILPMQQYGGCLLYTSINGMNELLNIMPLDENNLKRAKLKRKTDIETDRTDGVDYIFAYINARSKGTDKDLRKDEYESLDKITLKDIEQFQKDNLADKPFTYCIVGQEGKIKWEDMQKLGEIKKLSLEEIFGY